MVDLLTLTLEQRLPLQQQGQTANFRWQWLSEGILECIPFSEYKKNILLSAGIHGNETAPIELLAKIIDDLFASRLLLKQRVLFVFGNPEAIRQGKRYLENDMNRMFCGGHRQLEQDTETQRTALLEQITAQFFQNADTDSKSYHYDLHTAIRASLLPVFALLPFQKQAYDQTLIESLKAANLDALVYHNAQGKTFTHFTAEYCHVASTTLELGKAKPFGQNDLSEFSDINQILRINLSDEVLPPRRKSAMRQFKVISSIIKHDDDFQLQLTADAPNFSTFVRDELIASQSSGHVIAQNDQVWILFPNPNVKKGLRAGLLLQDMREFAID